MIMSDIIKAEDHILEAGTCVLLAHYVSSPQTPTFQLTRAEYSLALLAPLSTLLFFFLFFLLVFVVRVGVIDGSVVVVVVIVAIVDDDVVILTCFALPAFLPSCIARAVF